MRFMRVVSLVAGITLLVTGLAGLLGRRAEVGRARDQRLESSAELVTARLDATVARITAAMAVATPDTPVELLADALAMPVCAVPPTAAPRRCSSTSFDLAPDDAVTAALDAAAGQPAPVVLVAHAPGAARPACSWPPTRATARCWPRPRWRPATWPPGTSAVLVPVADEPLLRPRTVGDVRAYAAPSLVEFEDGPWAVRTTTRAAVRLTTDERWLIGAQLAVGAVLAALALGGHRRRPPLAAAAGDDGRPDPAAEPGRVRAARHRGARPGSAATAARPA